MFNLLSEEKRHLYTAVPSPSGLHPNIEFVEGSSDQRVIKQLDDWFSNNQDGIEGTPLSPFLYFVLPNDGGTSGYPHGDLSLEFLRYNYDGSVSARLLQGPTDEPTGITFQVFKGDAPVDPQVAETRKAVLDADKDASRPGRMAMMDMATQYGIETTLRIEDIVFRNAEREAYRRDSVVAQEGPDDYEWELQGTTRAPVFTVFLTQSGRIRNFNLFVWLAAERLLISNAKEAHLNDAFLNNARLRFEKRITELVERFLDRVASTENVTRSTMTMISETRIHSSLPIIHKGTPHTHGVARARRLPEPSLDMKGGATHVIDPRKSPSRREEIVTPVYKSNRRGPRTSEAHKLSDAYNIKPQKSYKLTPEHEQDIDALIASAVIEGTIAPLVGVCCDNCKSGSGDSQCSRCKSVNYCSRECQTEHWRKAHRSECRGK